MIYQLRIFKDHPGRVQAHLDRFRDHTNELLEKHGAKMVGCWRALDEGHKDEVVYLVAYESVESMEAGQRAFNTDPEQARMVAASEEDGPIIISRDNWVLEPAECSVLK